MGGGRDLHSAKTLLGLGLNTVLSSDGISFLGLPSLPCEGCRIPERA